jgi:rubrerythrin
MADDIDAIDGESFDTTEIETIETTDVRTDREATGDGDGEGVSRRGVLAGAAGAALLSAVPLSLGADSARAQQDDGRSDVDILNYALTLEHLENEFYIQQLETFNERDFQRSDLLDEFGFGMRFTARDYLRVVQEHEQAHVDFLTTAIEDAGGSPVSAAAEYNFAAPLGKDEIETVEEFTAVAAVLEATGVDAYAGAAPEISNAAYIPPALSIHSVEANHAAYLRNLNGDVPMPDAFNEAKSIDEVLGIVDPIIVRQ